jgi:uncharacterized membrane protein YccF (DUF307 family)
MMLILARLAWIFTFGAMLCMTMVCVGLFFCFTVVLFPVGVTCFAVGFKLVAPPF